MRERFEIPLPARLLHFPHVYYEDRRMKSSLCTLLLISALLLPNLLFAQVERKDRAVFVEPRNEFMDTIRARLERFNKKEEPKKKDLRVDLSSFTLPDSTDRFTQYWHSKPISQGLTGTCWCFSTTSFFESEIYRLTKRQIKLSEMFTVYWEYVEKARRFIRERGNSEFGEGSEANAVIRIWKQYGIVPEDAYTGLKPGQPFHDHERLFAELNGYLQTIKTTNAWNEDQTLATVRDILNHYLGKPPESVRVDGDDMTPKEYLEKVVKLNLDEYVDFMSLMEKPYYQKAEYEVPDNWWHSKEYYNVPLDDFMGIIKQALRKGYTLCIGGDTSEPGYEGHTGVGVIPTFDIPPAYIDENAREFRFNNKTTTDDHGIHIVGFLEKGGKVWFLIKDSAAGSRNNWHPGYYYYHEDYVKLKVMDAMVHRSAVEDVLKKMQNSK